MELLQRCVTNIFLFFTKCWKRIVMFVLVFVISFTVINLAVIKAKSNFAEVMELQQAETQLCVLANEDYTGNQYKSIEGERYMVELFPFGQTDNPKYDPDVGRIIKITFYDSSRTKVVHEEYKIVKRVR